MRLPNIEKAIVSREKLIDYLLSPSHPSGKHKAAFFSSFGFTVEDWEIFQAALLVHATNEVAREEKSPFGKRYVVEAPLPTPDGRNPLVRSVWFIENDFEEPRFVTAYPS